MVLFSSVPGRGAMRLARTVAAIAAIAVIAPGVPAAAQTISVVSPSLPGIIYAERGVAAGPYAAFIQRLAELGGIEISHEVATFGRSRGLFERGRVDCRFPVTNVGEGVLVTPAFNRIKFVIVTPPGSTPLTDPAELAGRTVGLVTGLGYPDGIAETAGATEDSPNESTNMRKLLAGRLDAMITVLPDFNLAAGGVPGSDTLVMDTTRPLLEQVDRIVCHDTDAGRRAIAAFEHGLAGLGEDGIRALLGVAYVE